VLVRSFGSPRSIAVAYSIVVTSTHIPNLAVVRSPPEASATTTRLALSIVRGHLVKASASYPPSFVSKRNEPHHGADGDEKVIDKVASSEVDTVGVTTRFALFPDL